MAEMAGMIKGMQKDITPNTMALLVFLCGTTNDISLNIIGEFYLSELLILLLAVFGLFLWQGYESFNARIFRSFLLAGGVTLIGYIISDIYVGTDPSRYLRGWGRTIILISDCFAIMLLAMKSRQNLWWFMLGSGIGGVIYLYSTGLPFQIWKLGYGERFTMIFLALLIVMPRRFWGGALLAYGLLNIVLDYRSLGAGLILTAAIVTASSARSNKRLMVIVVAGVVMFMALVAALNMTRDEYLAHRVTSNIGRTSAIIVSLRAIVQSPLIGYGSWTINKEYASELRKEIQERKAESGENIDFARTRSGSGFRSHSQIIQSWVEGGLMGASFFLFYGYRLLQSIVWCALKRPLDVFTPLFTCTLVMGIWNLFMSPFLGFSRIQIALVVGVVVILMIEKQGKAIMASPKATEAEVPKQSPRLLKKARSKSYPRA